MEEKDKYETSEVEIDLGRIFLAIMERAWVVVIVSVLCAAIAFGITFAFITPKYQSSAVFYVNNSAATGNTSQSINSNDLVTSRGLVDSYIVILRTRETLNAVIDHVGLDLRYEQIKGMISAGAVNETEMFRVTVTSTDPEEAASIANAIAYVLPKQISNIIDGTSAKIVEYAEVPSGPSSPSYPKNILLGFLAGFLMCAGMITLKEIFDTTIHSEEDIEQICDHPILSLVPDMQPGVKQNSDSYSYAYGGKQKKKKKLSAKEKEKAAKQNESLIGGNISFAASEAYKRLRTKLQFSFADDNGCRVIGMSSALSGEGKSLTSVNLAYALAQLNKRVILLDCDMRRPTLAEKTGLNKKPGLSEYLTGQYEFKEVLQRFSREHDEVVFHVVSAGDNPPNPMEMLSSLRMERLLSNLRGAYDYVLLDLPPVSEVSDALAMSSKVDGMLLVVRQNYGDRIMFGDALRQFSFINARILGIVFNGTSEYGGDYYGTGYYGHYYRRYYRKYYNRYHKHYAKGYGYNPEKKA